MKKLKLKALSLGAREILSREQLKQVNGGSTNSGCCWTTGYGQCWTYGIMPLWTCKDGLNYCGPEEWMYGAECENGCC